jgi:hypothetical protein
MLSPQAEAVINDYLQLPFPKDRSIACPYYNNRRGKIRGALRVLVGKGGPEEIVEEALIISLRDKIDLDSLDDATLKKFLVNHHLGVDCSGLAFHILNAEVHARGKGKLKNYLTFPKQTGLLRRLILKLRPAENTSVKVLAAPENSVAVAWPEAQPGDLIIMLGTNPKHDYDHVLVVEQVEPHKITYVHALQWSSDGLYDHGARRGIIEITDPNLPLTKQRWIEKRKQDEANERIGEMARVYLLGGK